MFFPHEHHERVAHRRRRRARLRRRRVSPIARRGGAPVRRARQDVETDHARRRLQRFQRFQRVHTHRARGGVQSRQGAGKTEKRKRSLPPSATTRRRRRHARARCVFEVAFTIGDATKNAHKRLMEKPLAENAGAIGEIRLSNAARDVWLAHLKRNRHYEDKYGEGKESSSGEEWRREWWDENVAARATRAAAPRRGRKRGKPRTS